MVHHWSSFSLVLLGLLMLERIQKVQQPLCAVLLENPHEIRYLLHDGEGWMIIEELIGVLKPFHRATTAISALSHPTLSMLGPLSYKLLDIVLKVDERDTPSGKHLKEAIATDLYHRYASLNHQQMLRSVQQLFLIHIPKILTLLYLSLTGKT